MQICRRLERKQRQSEWAAFLGARPDPSAEHPADVAALQAAKASVGDYKLRSDPASAAAKVRQPNTWCRLLCPHAGSAEFAADSMLCASVPVAQHLLAMHHKPWQALSWKLL